MARAAGLIGAGFAAFLAALVIFAPAQLAFDLFARPAGVSAGLISGSIWEARAWRVSAGSVRVDAVEFGVRPASLLSGAAALDADVSGPDLQFQGVVRAGLSQTAFEQVRGVAQLRLFPAFHGLPLPTETPVQLRIDRLAFDHDGACLTADGRITSTALMDFGARQAVELPVIEGELYCAGAVAAVAFTGASDTLALDGVAQMTGPDPSWRMEARTTDRSVITALVLLGFEQQGEVFVVDSTAITGG